MDKQGFGKYPSIISALFRAIGDVFASMFGETNRDDPAIELGPEIQAILDSAGASTVRQPAESHALGKPRDGKTARRFDRRDAFERYKACQHRLSKGQWAAVSCYFNDEMTQEEIAHRLGVSRKAVSGRLKRAERKMEAYYRALRAEQFDRWKKRLDEDPDS